MNSIYLYTDGSARLALQKGGWGVVITSDSEITTLRGDLGRTTSTQAELWAVIHALEHISPDSTPSVYTDCLCIVQTMTGQKNFRGNRELWFRLQEAARRFSQVSWIHIHKRKNNFWQTLAHKLSRGEDLPKEMPKGYVLKSKFSLAFD